MSLFYFLWDVLTKRDQPAREPYIFGNCGRPAAKNTFQGFGQELSVEDIIAPLKGSLVLPKVCKKLFPRFGGEIKTGGWAGRGLPSWNKVQTNMHSHFQIGKKWKCKIFSPDRNNDTIDEHFHFQPSKSESENDSLWWEQCSKWHAA